MDISTETLVILLVLIPGFVSSAILDMVLLSRRRDTTAKLIEALMLSFLIYAVLGGIFRMSPFSTSTPQVSTDVDKLRSQISPGFVLATLGAAILLPLAMGFVARRNWHMKVLHKCSITDRTDRASVWLDVFSDQRSYVICNLSGGRRIFGWPLYYSEEVEGCGPMLYLHDPRWILESGEYVELGGAGILLVEKDGIESIEFTGFADSPGEAQEDEDEQGNQQQDDRGSQGLQPPAGQASKESAGAEPDATREKAVLNDAGS